MHALLAAMQSRSAFGAIPPEIDIRRKRRSTLKTARGDYVLHQSRKFRSRDIDRGLGALLAAPQGLLWPVCPV